MPSSTTNKLQFFLKWVALPYLVGWFLSSELLVPNDVFQRFLPALQGAFQPPPKKASSAVDPKQQQQQQQEQRREQEEKTADKQNSSKNDDNKEPCWNQFLRSLGAKEQAALNELMEASGSGAAKVLVHRNGVTDVCGESPDILSVLKTTLSLYSAHECPKTFDKYQMESILTSTLHQSLQKSASCVSEEVDREEGEGFLGFCDMTPEKTPILPDHEKLVPIVLAGNDSASSLTYLPCHFHTREGVRVSSFQSLITFLSDMWKEQQTNQSCAAGEGEDGVCGEEANKNNKPTSLHLYSVPAGRVFVFAPSFVGEFFDLPHIEGADPTLPVYLEVLSLSPKVFDIFNFFTKEESDGLVTKAMAEKSESHRIKRSSTGASGYNVNTRRTSDSGFDTHGKTAVAVKK